MPSWSPFTPNAVPTSRTSGASTWASSWLTGIQLVLARAVRDRVVDLDAVLGGELLHDRAVICPVRGQRDDVQLSLLLGRRDQRFHSAALRDGGRRPPVDCATSRVLPRAAAARARGTACGGEQQAADKSGWHLRRNHVPCAHSSSQLQSPRRTGDQDAKSWLDKLRSWRGQDQRGGSPGHGWRPSVPGSGWQLLGLRTRCRRPSCPSCGTYARRLRARGAWPAAAQVLGGEAVIGQPAADPAVTGNPSQFEEGRHRLRPHHGELAGWLSMSGLVGSRLGAGGRSGP